MSRLSLFKTMWRTRARFKGEKSFLVRHDPHRRLYPAASVDCSRSANAHAWLHCVTAYLDQFCDIYRHLYHDAALRHRRTRTCDRFLERHSSNGVHNNSKLSSPYLNNGRFVSSNENGFQSFRIGNALSLIVATRFLRWTGSLPRRIKL